MTLLISILLLAAANRFAGMAFPFNKEVFGLAVCISCGFLGLPLGVCVASGLLGYAGRQFISHGAVYQVEAGKRKRGPWWAICFTRAALIAAPLAAPAALFVPVVAATATAMLGINILSRHLEDKNIVGRVWRFQFGNDMLLMAEPLQGAALGVMLCVLAGGMQ